MAYNYDLLVIGAGSAGLAAAKQAATYGVNVAIVEQEQLGGVCTNRGCIPKKLMVYAADLADSIGDAPSYGWSVAPSTFSWQRFIAARDQEIERIHRSQQQALSHAGVEILRGHAAFVDPHTIELDDRKLSAERIVIAVGGVPQKPPISGIEYTITSREMFQLQELPAHLAIIGGGYIGVEFASTLRSLGIEVTLIDTGDAILSGFDRDVRMAVQTGLKQRGIQIINHATAKVIQPTANRLQLTLDNQSTDEIPETITADTILCATGRTANLDPLKLEQAGVDRSDKAIAVDLYSRTSQDHIFAVGDCTNRLPLTPAARAEGRACIDTIFGPQPRQLDYDRIPSAVFARPEAASVGMTEDKARDTHGGDAIDTDCIKFVPLYQRLTGSEQPALFKRVIDRQTDRILGIHIVGAHAAEIIQGLALALNQGVTKHDMDQTIGIHPTSAEELFG
jgi:glutathione reductase (NADPH)